MLWGARALLPLTSLTHCTHSLRHLAPLLRRRGAGDA